LRVVTAFYYEPDMSESVPVKIYYGIGEIIYGPQVVTCQILVQLKKIFQEQEKELGRL
jgi:hypothetical protein